MRLFINTYGTKISFSKGVLVIETPDKKQEIPLVQITALHLTKSIRISTDAIINCVKQNIPVIIENNFEVFALLWTPNFNSIATTRKKQALLSFSSLKLEIVKKAIITKNTERYNMIKTITENPMLQKTAQQILQYNSKIRNTETGKMLRTYEAHAGKIFFRIFRKLLPKYCPFPGRTYPNANDLVNSLLNYGYGFLYNEVTKALILAGLDPHIGFFHRDQYGKTAFTYDMIEPYRPWIEFQVLKFCRKTSPETLKNCNGTLTREIKKQFASQITTFLDNTKIRWRNRAKTPRTHILLDMYKTAKTIRQIDNETILSNIRHNGQ